jgi:phosphoribosylaminoimidazolecarboxamide formyltransferase / IMP cyclohydrolase
MCSMREPARRALLSVYDKTGLMELARALSDLGFTLVSSGGTASALREAGLTVTPVEQVTGFPEMLDGRVKTLHPRIHAGILADRRSQAHVQQLAEQGIEPFELVIVNLYPFRETVAAGASFDEVIEKIDVGGPAMVRAAAKNFESVGVVVDPARYRVVADEIRSNGELTREARRELAAAAFAHTAAYDAAIATWFAQHTQDGLPATFDLAFEKIGELRYGENPHQRGALYRDRSDAGPLGGAEVLGGKEMSFNNWLDVYAACDLAGALPPDSAVIVKHNNPCGAAASSSCADSYRRAFECDEVSAFGGVVAFNGTCDESATAAMSDVFTEVVAATGFTDGALAAFATKKNLRVLRVALPVRWPGLEIRPLPGGALVQDPDVVHESRSDFKVVSSREPTPDEWEDLSFAWTVSWRVRSNAIVFAKDGATVGIGAGQMSRVDAAWMAVRKAGEKARGASMASDAFFPFSDAVEVAADAGVTAVIHPGGSVRDEETLAAAEARGMSVVLTGVRHFRH